MFLQKICMDDSRTAQIQALIEPIVAERGLEMVELSYRPYAGQLHIRVLVDCPTGATIERCAHVNRLISQSLEQANLIEERYTVEVSSPGLDRPLVSRRDFERAIGEQLRLIVDEGEGRVQERHGMVLAVAAENVVLKTDAGNVTLPLGQIRTAKKILRW